MENDAILVREDAHNHKGRDAVGIQQLVPISAAVEANIARVRRRMKALEKERTGRSNVIAYAVKRWADEIDAGIDIASDDLSRYLESYIATVHPTDGTSGPDKKNVYLRSETVDNIERIGKYLHSLKGSSDFVVPMLWGKSGYNRTLIILLALQKASSEID